MGGNGTPSNDDLDQEDSGTAPAEQTNPWVDLEEALRRSLGPYKGLKRIGDANSKYGPSTGLHFVSSHIYVMTLFKTPSTEVEEIAATTEVIGNTSRGTEGVPSRKS